MTWSLLTRLARILIHNDVVYNIDHDAGIIYYYTDWPLYLYHKSEGNTNKAQKYLTDAYNHIPEDERAEYLENENHLENLPKYYYIHEIIDTYNQNIR